MPNPKEMKQWLEDLSGEEHRFENVQPVIVNIGRSEAKGLYYLHAYDTGEISERLYLLGEPTRSWKKSNVRFMEPHGREWYLATWAPPSAVEKHPEFHTWGVWFGIHECTKLDLGYDKPPRLIGMSIRTWDE